eukprot:NODE_7324_length_1590_cov_6.107314.p1 GENE.NODE_7324_length_1590_cov_6.107314~~NODE_7324_length_1590_cov_6.107314.p1  ORF type:complete len:329 (-),score=92.13 NODE_7324_length_1590_cov_6.107314:357-1343(-)
MLCLVLLGALFLLSGTREAPAPRFSPRVIKRPPVGKILVDELFAGVDPMAAAGPDLPMLGHGQTHVSKADVTLVLENVPQPVRLWLELGSYEGGSAIRAAEIIKELQSDIWTTLVAIDPFLGDRTSRRDQLLRPDGTSELYDHFRANIVRAGFEAIVLPLPTTSVFALSLLSTLAANRVVPRPQVIYLDSAHDEGETLLEMQLAWDVLDAGGIMFGDDWALKDPHSPGAGAGPVQRDVLRFAGIAEAELDDAFANGQWPALSRVRHGLFVSVHSFQWFMKKRTGPKAASRGASTPPLPSQPFALGLAGAIGHTCCNEELAGPGDGSQC